MHMYIESAIMSDIYFTCKLGIERILNNYFTKSIKLPLFHQEKISIIFSMGQLLGLELD